jgi:K+-transporting ATPase ATPase C chain
MKAVLKPAIVLLSFFVLLTGVLYPLAVWAAAQGIFPAQANGSLVMRDGHALGSTLIGQAFDDPRYFWGRPSAVGYDAAASAGSNLGPSNPALQEAVAQRIAALQAADPGNAAPIPADLVTASGSGLDPHISPASAYYQAGRVARLRGLPEAQVVALVERLTLPRQLGFLGEPTVNVLELNLALDGLQ